MSLPSSDFGGGLLSHFKFRLRIFTLVIESINFLFLPFYFHFLSFFMYGNFKPSSYDFMVGCRYTG